MDELVKALRETDFGDTCVLCEHEDMCKGNDCIIIQAADAIEKLGNWWSQADKLIQMLEMPRWIPVTERLPIGGDDSGAICENVCLLMDDGTVSCGWMNGITKKAYYLNARDDVVIKAPITRVTHWMPLPEPPKEEI